METMANWLDVGPFLEGMEDMRDIFARELGVGHVQGRAVVVGNLDEVCALGRVGHSGRVSVV